MEKKLKNWLEQSIAEIKASGDVKNIHIDELLGFELKSKEEFLMRSCEILQQLQLVAQNFDLSDYRLDLNLELNESEDNVRRPLELKEIIDDIDIQSMPEILIFKPFVDNNLRISMVETYRTPILFEVCDGIKNFKIFYAQYRTYNDNKINENFMRWLNFIYQK